MATEYTKTLDVVTKVRDTVTGDVYVTHSGETLSPALSTVAAAQTASSYTLDNVAVDGLIEVTVGAASTNIPIPVPFACKIVDAWAYKVGVSADAGDVLAIKKGATDLLTFALNVADGLRVSGLGTGIDHADNSFAAGDGITVDPTNSTDCACNLFIRVKRTA